MGIHILSDINIECPSIMTQYKMGKIKNPIFYSHSYLGFVVFALFSAWLI